MREADGISAGLTGDERGTISLFSVAGEGPAKDLLLLGAMDAGGAEAIASRGQVSAHDELLDAAAMESGTD